MHDTISGDVKQYSYRTANVRDVLFTIPRNLVRPLEAHLAEKAGVREDNHTVYEIRDYGKKVYYILFSDFSAVFARTVVERSW